MVPLPNHVGIVVSNLKEWIEKYSKLGVGPWKLIDAADITDTTVDGKPEHFSVKCAIASIGPIELELVQPVEGRDLCRKFLDEKGEGFHHILFYVDDLQTAVAQMERLGMHVAQGGKDYGKIPWVYMDTHKVLGLPVLELMERPKPMISESSTKRR